MCNQKFVDPGLPAACFDSDEDASGPVEDEHHVIFDCSGYVYARQLFPGGIQQFYLDRDG